MPKEKEKPAKKRKYPARTFRMKDEVYECLEEIAASENRSIGNQLEELILRNRVGGDNRK